MLSYGAIKIVRNKPHLIVYQENSELNILDGCTLISPPNRKNINVVVLYLKIMKNKPHFMVFQNFQILKIEMVDFDLGAKSKMIFVTVLGWKITINKPHFLVFWNFLILNFEKSALLSCRQIEKYLWNRLVLKNHEK